MPLPRMRTATQLATEYKTRDADTAVNVHFLRQLITLGVIPYVKAGKKYLINADAVDTYLTAGQTVSQDHEVGKIRPISTKDGT
jgi:excisionase family DNA binding protein